MISVLYLHAFYFVREFYSAWKLCHNFFSSPFRTSLQLNKSGKT